MRRNRSPRPSRAALSALALLAAIGAATPSAAGAAPAPAVPMAVATPSQPAAAPAPAVVAPAVLPPDLVALEQKMGQLAINSLRFSIVTSIVLPHQKHEAMDFLKIFGGDSTLSGEETIAPPAGNVKSSFFGIKLQLRTVGTTVYLYFAKLGHVDHGRPWVRLGPGGFAEIFSVNGRAPKPPAEPSAPTSEEPPLVQPPFTELQKQFAEASEVHELTPALIEGQPVTRFLAALPVIQPKRRTLKIGRFHVKAPPPPVRTLEASFNEAGLPLRIVIKEVAAGVTTTATLAIPAINFPLVIEAPPAAQTIDIAALRRLEKRSAQARARARRRRRQQREK